MDKEMRPDDEDLTYEEDVLRNPYFLKSWLRYLDFKKDAPRRVRDMIFERALKSLPGSYKLWQAYLTERTQYIRGRCLTDHGYEVVNNVFERALVFMHKMPRIWVDYCQFLVEQEKITRTRRTLDRALRSLPITQHDRIWRIYLRFIRKIDIPQTACRVYRRYLKLEPDGVEEYIDYLSSPSVGYYDEAARLLAKAVNDDKFESRQGKTKHQMWLDLCEMISKHPKDIVSVKVEPILRGGIRKFSDEVGRLWTSLAEYFIQLAQFEKARDIFEEAVNKVKTVRDFSHIWEAYTQFEDSLVSAKMELLSDPDGLADADIDIDEENADFDLLVARYEYLIERQPLLLSSVLLRQNPHNVYEWHKRVKLMPTPKKIVECYKEALETVDPLQAKGKPHTIWCAFARYYETHKRPQEARAIFEKATQVNFKTIDEVAAIWCEYAEMEMRLHNYDGALEVLKKATVTPRKGLMSLQDDASGSTSKRSYKSVKLWSFLADLEENLGTFDTTKSVYDKIIELRIATPQLILNYACWLEENRHFEDSFKAYEKGVSIFTFPYVHDIWIMYLNKFVKRYGGQKLERSRDLFEQVLEKVPAKDAKVFYVMYAQLEEEYGLSRHAMQVYDRACRTVDESDRYKMYMLYIQRATEYFGVTHTREIYERAIESLPDKYVKDVCLKFSDMERKLGEIDRARAIYTHASQFCDPRTDPKFWTVWSDFEKRHGNEDTFREMLRIKRSVQAQYNTQINLMSAQMLAASKKAEDEETAKSQLNMMAALERQAKAEIMEDAKPKPSLNEPKTDKQRQDALVERIVSTNPEEIVIREEGEEESFMEEGDEAVEELAVPSAVFGAAADSAAEVKKQDRERMANVPEDEGNEQPEEEDNAGALARFKRRRGAANVGRR